MERRLFTPEEVAEMLSIGRTTVFRLIRDGDLPIVKIGKRTLIRGEDIDSMIEGHTTRLEPTTDRLSMLERDRAIRAAYATGMKQGAIARAYGITRQRVQQIVAAPS